MFIKIILIKINNQLMQAKYFKMKNHKIINKIVNKNGIISMKITK